jgi:hypothetical protein
VVKAVALRLLLNLLAHVRHADFNKFLTSVAFNSGHDLRSALIRCSWYFRVRGLIDGSPSIAAINRKSSPEAHPAVRRLRLILPQFGESPSRSFATESTVVFRLWQINLPLIRIRAK